MNARRLAPDAEIPGLDGATIGDFWAWAYSDILLNTTRGVFVEFVVGTALGVVGGVRGAWDSFDLLYEGSGIEVKSSAYVQSWLQEKPSFISWGIEVRQDVLEHYPDVARADGTRSLDVVEAADGQDLRA